MHSSLYQRTSNHFTGVSLCNHDATQRNRRDIRKSLIPRRRWRGEERGEYSENRHLSGALQHNGPGSEAGCIVIISKVVDASSMNPMKAPFARIVNPGGRY